MQSDSQPRFSGDITNITTGFRNVGLVFAVLGLGAILAPAVATLVVEQLVAWLLVFWGIAGLVFAWSFRSVPEWRFAALFFAAVLLFGLAFVFFPSQGAEFITGVMVVVFLLEGALSIQLGLKLRGHVSSWVWIVLSGICALVLGLVILVQWPTTSTWILGFLTGLNFLSTGITMFMVSRAAGKLSEAGNEESMS